MMRKISFDSLICQSFFFISFNIHYFIRNAEKNEEELVRSSVEYISTCLRNLSESHHLESLDHELQKVQSDLKQVQLDIAKMKSKPEATAGTTSERIEKCVMKCVLY